MNNKEFKQELIQELLLNIYPSYYKQIEILSLSVYILYSKQFHNTILNKRSDING